MERLRREGINLYYEEAAGGDPPIVLVHGWCCDHTYFAPQFERYAGRGHRVVAVDLRGHGRSDKPEGSYAMGVFADDLAWVCEQIGLEKPVVIGHSMGGIVAFDLAARYPTLPSAAVMLDAAIVLPSASREAIPGMLKKLGGPDYREVLHEYASGSLFIPTDDPDRKENILSAMISTPQHVIVSAMQGLHDYDPAALDPPKVPGVYIAADEAQPRSDMSRFHEMFPDIFYGKTVGSGHFCQLEVPEQIGAMVDRFLAVALPR
jgi:pimeloyl-ACP methyl ester carboxylesterase